MRPNRNKRIGLLVPLLIALLLAACSSGGTGSAPNEAGEQGQAPAAGGTYPENGLPKDEKVKLKIAVWENGNGREWVDYAMQSFSKKFPNVTFEPTYSPTISTIITTKASANDDNDMFDIFSTGISGATSLQLVQSGKLLPQSDLWDRKLYDSGKTVREAVADGIFESVAKDMYALPVTTSGFGLFFDKSLFEKKGWNQNPKTWSEFVQLIERIRADGVIPITVPGKVPGYIASAFLTGPMFQLAEMNGNAKSFDDAYRNFTVPYLSTPEARTAFQRLAELGKKGAFPDGMAALTHTQAQMQLLQGQAAMVPTGDWVQNEMKDAVPKDFRWGFMVVPMNDKPDQPQYMRTSVSGPYFIWAAKPDLNKKWAKEFVLSLLNLDVQQMMAEKGGAGSVRKDFMDDRARADKVQAAPRAVMEYVKANRVKSVTDTKNVRLTDPAAAQADKAINEALPKIALGEQDPLPVMAEAATLLQKAIDAQKKP
ncbi:ABC transporter substrate-binding protein [Paenibacillus flagellatus]|uniref:ABC transporter substrate-binding protein n=1 Tax=Paenibacillus flagellatus TaxID=2211139 RepID=A0A2V5KAB7_9BACL|nr:extracellular solute-binding protein [Paenibacillus flagellatus]PYI56545.1 ABC transporter substrate-binding protein [Paenibacillus flagellatus]